MRRIMLNILKASSFLLILAITLLTASYIFVPKNNYKDFGMDNIEANGILGERENSIDVIVVGDSEAYSSISPMQIWGEKGITSYVCATPAQQMYMTLQFVKQAFKYQSPKIIIMETNAIYRETKAENFLTSKIESLFSIFKYHNRWKTISPIDFGGSISYTWTDDYKGFYYKTNITPAENKEYMIKTEEVKEIPKWNLTYLSEIAELCEHNDAKLILLSTPSSENWNYEKHNGIQAYAEQNGITYLDMNLLTDEIGIDWEKDTRDKGDHLNYSGAVKVSLYLGEYLKNNYELTDQRENPQYSDWNTSLKKYQTLVGIKK